MPKGSTMTKARKTHVYHAVLAEASLDATETGMMHLNIYSVDDEFHFVMPRATLRRLWRQMSNVLGASAASQSSGAPAPARAPV
jgi:hypothetical protein